MRGAEPRDRRRHQGGADAREGDHPHATAAQAGDGLQLGLGVGEAGEDDVGMGDQGAPGVREGDAALAPLDQARAGLALQRRDLLRDGGLRVGERLGGGGEGALRCDLAQDAHTADVKH